MSPRRILLIRLSAIGDVLNALPAMWALRAARPEAHIAWLVEDRAAGAIEGQAGVDEVIVFERKRWSERGLAAWREALAWIRALRARDFDVSVDLQGNLKSAALALLAGAPTRISAPPGHVKEMAWLAANAFAQPRSRRQSRAWHHVDLVGPLGARREMANGRFTVGGARRALDAGASIDGLPRPRVLLHPGTSRFGAFKRWPVAHFSALARELHGQTGASVIVACGPGEEELARAVVDAAPFDAQLAPQTRTLADLARQLGEVDVFVGADSAPLHLAALVGTPSVALYGPKDPALYAPIAGRTEVLTVDLPCRPCGLRRCLYTAGPEEASPCMERLSPLAVAAAVAALLRAPEIDGPPGRR